MSLLCWWKQRGLANAVVSSDTLDNYPHLQKHLQCCPECRSFWNEVRQLSRELNGLVEPLPAPDGFASAVWARVTTHPAPRRRSVGVLAPVAALSFCAALGLVFVPRTPPQPAELPAPAATGQRILPRKAPQVADVKKGTPPNPKNSSVELKGRSAAGKNRLSGLQLDTQPVKAGFASGSPVLQGRAILPQPRWLLKKDRPLFARRDRKQRMRVAQVKEAFTPKAAPKQQGVSRSTPPKWAQWTRWGMWYEAQGDYRRAAAAYGSAYAENSDPDLAFAAGQAAESAGDVTEALTYYTQILNCSQEKNDSQKGTDTWTHEPGTV